MRLARRDGGGSVFIGLDPGSGKRVGSGRGIEEPIFWA